MADNDVTPVPAPVVPVPTPVVAPVVPVLQSKKVWAAIIGVVLAGIAGFVEVHFKVPSATVLPILGIVEGIVVSFLGTQAWQDGKVYSAQIEAELQKVLAAINVAQSIDPTKLNLKK